MRIHALFVVVVLFTAVASGQKPEYDFYEEFRGTFKPRMHAERPSITNDEIIKKYAAKLRSEGVAGSEIDRRTGLLRDEPHVLESDHYNRFYTDPESKFNRAPNAFLMEVAIGRKPGIALDYGMGEGRNSIYLAQLGWDVYGFDPADAAVALAQGRANRLGLTLNTEAIRDIEYEFGRERFDLILFSWTMPLVPVERVIGSLKPGGIVVVEVAANFVGPNGMLKMFDSLQVMRYEIVQAKADFYNQQEVEVVRMVATKQ